MVLWARLAANDIAIRYQRSLIGPFWITLTMAIFVASVGLLYAGLLGQDTRLFIHFVAAGLVVWQFFSSTIVEGSSALISSRDFLLNTKVPPFVLVLRVVARNFIIMLHNLPILVLTIYIAWPNAGLNIPLFLFGMFLLTINTTWLTMILAVVSARFRDTPPMVAAIMQLMFICSPIIWTPAVLPEKTIFVTGNPIAYFVDAVRNPLLATPDTMLAYGVSAACAVLGSFIAILVYHHNKDKICYWV